MDFTSKFPQNAICETKLNDAYFTELEAYSCVVTALRAQGDLNKERRKILQDLSTVLNVSIDRHKAEVRRAVNDELLNTIATK